MDRDEAMHALSAHLAAAITQRLYEVRDSEFATALGLVEVSQDVVRIDGAANAALLALLYS